MWYCAGLHSNRVSTTLAPPQAVKSSYTAIQSGRAREMNYRVSTVLLQVKEQSLLELQ
jgi:hypothetical protein